MEKDDILYIKKEREKFGVKEKKIWVKKNNGVRPV